ncbi:DinB family protein [Lysinibacillus fusiformis]|uniref:DinB family protein n=1 Tax=Lysinibacillus fusiformis TaxID=28031 RepID=UPI0035566610
MQLLFKYNWMVREDWFRWCEELSEEELLENRTGGMGNILHTLFHIVDVEWSWIRILQGKEDFQENFDDYKSLEKVRKLTAEFHLEVESFVNKWDASMEERLLHLPLEDGTIETHTWGEIIRHTIAHEIHHIGQLSIWAREIGRKPVSANLIRRGLSSAFVDSVDALQADTK